METIDNYDSFDKMVAQAQKYDSAHPSILPIYDLLEHKKGPVL